MSWRCRAIEKEFTERNKKDGILAVSRLLKPDEPEIVSLNVYKCMKKNEMHDLSWRERLLKTCLIMKFVVLLLFVSTLHLSASVYSQEARVTVHLQDASFEDVVKVLENSTNFTFLYRDHQVAQIKNLNLQYTEADIKVILDACLKGSGLTYRLVDNTIVIQPVYTAVTDSIAKITVKGVVKDEKGEILPGVTIRVKGTTIGFVTNAKGEFDFDLPKRDNLVLIFSFVGFQRQEVQVKNEMKPLTIVMKEDVQSVDEVVITGIFNKPKESFTGAVTAVSKEELRAKYSRNLLQTLSNIDPSFRIIQNNDAGSNPNHLPEIQLRGASTLSSVEDLQNANRASLNYPLFILDGFEVDLERVMDLNDNEVENITILKDASATSLYGSRGANGVIVITTTRPSAGKLRVSYNGQVKIEVPDLSSYNLATATEKLEFERKNGVWDNENYQMLYEELKAAIDKGENYDWLSVPVRTGIGQTHRLSFMGGSDDWRFRFDLSYDSTVGVMKGSDRNNFNGTLEVDYMTDKWTVMQSLSVGLNTSEDSPYGSFSDYARMNRYWNPYDENGNAMDYYYHPLNSNPIDNPLYNWSVGCWNDSEYTSLRSNTSIRYTIKPGFQLAGSVGLSRQISRKDNFTPPSHKWYIAKELEQKGRYDRTDKTTDRWQAGLTMNYANTFKEKHMLTVNLNGEIQEDVDENVRWAATGFLTDKIDNIGMSLGYPDSWGTSGEETTTRRISLRGSVNYYYDMRYFFDISYSTDGSSSFGSESRWGAFWSVGGGWNIYNESFIKERLGWISDFRVRYSYGVSGNMGFSPADAMTVYRQNTNETYLAGVGVDMVSFANPHLKWQNTYQHNTGFDLGFFSNRLTFQFNYYNKLTDNAVQRINLPISHGFEYYMGNIGKIRNEGYELNVTVYPIRNTSKNINWSITGRFSRQINTIVKLSEGFKESVKYDVKTMNGAQEYYRYIEGHSMDAIYGLRSVGIDPLSGYRMFLDKNNDITFTQSSNDLVFLGDRQPKVSGNVNTSFSYKGISVNIGFNVKWGGYQVNFTEMTKGENLYLLYNIDKRALTQGWEKPGDKSRYKAYNVNSDAASQYTYPCDMFVHKDNIFSCSNINVSYVIPRKWCQKMGMETLTVSAYLSDIFYLSTIKRERGTDYPFSINPNFSISCSF